ncbi:putative WEB family protein At1g65010, chloroplastic isoform X2 [Manihot esculenta]|uniref:Uncharacterized protein n=7 Tax=Manihot esculenta TaxID=3983 RepID=A0ACB7FZG3_MANES|nr:putative WEB family protein At1g65010, chloroplastic isoform X2 [Manihot esculenta]KAG8632997.1 hypothetical protein MANES_18G071100v8 [Manihot esculenta]KAG8632998.1 hypothetical protein MANES_18G071100v8 [Manihot esculenta]KAG8632999.1 hypothetical protein MANES_18G071100v8 [Manihot esculenta]KAG8633001.1 hypothetical protein MANES_18G071100v8 [Manihot esculenta]KAG8633007.1 hypothetical protein MANES_18G071100v8 [Manihot esculenta]
MSRITKWKLEKTKVKVVFRLQFHATHIPQSGWDKLFISFIPTDSGKATSKTSKANVRNGTCKWADPIYETTRLLQDVKTKQYDEKLYKLVIAMGSSRSSILGEAIIDLADYADALNPSVVALPLHGCDSGTVLHVTVQLLTSKTGFREFEQQRELRERGLQSYQNSPDESSGQKVSSSEISYQIDKVNKRVRFKEKSKELASLEEEVGPNEEFADSAVGFDGSSNTSESLYAEKHESSGMHEIDGLRSTVSDGLAGLSPSPSPQLEKGDPSNHPFSVQGTNDWVHDWSSDYSVNNELAAAYEENSRLRGILEVAESSIHELTLEVSLLQRNADDIGHEAQKFAKQLAAEIVSGEEMAEEVSLLKSECAKLKGDLEQLKVSKLHPPFSSREAFESEQDHIFQDVQLRWLKGLLAMEDKIRELQNKTCFGYDKKDFRFLASDIEVLLGILNNLKQASGLAVSSLNLTEGARMEDIGEISHKNGQIATGTGFDVDLYQPELGMLHCLNIPGLISHESDAVDTINAMKNKIFELLRELDESKAEWESISGKMDQMECYYEALVQELEENQSQMLHELQNLRNEHSTCLFTISSTKAEMESMCQELNGQILRLAEDKHDLDSLNKELERRAVTAEAALKRARLNYSIVVDQLQKDLELLSVQVLSMYETNENLIRQTFADSSQPSVKEFDSGDYAAKLLQFQNHSVGIRKQQLGGDSLVLDDLKRSLHIQEGLYQKVEEEVCELHFVNIYFDVLSRALQETLLGANEDVKFMNEKVNELKQQQEVSAESKALLMQKLQAAMDDIHSLNNYKARCDDMTQQKQILELSLQNLAHENHCLELKITQWEAQVTQYRGFESKYEECSAENAKLACLLEQKTLENGILQCENLTLQDELKTIKTEFDVLASQKENLLNFVNFLQCKLQKLLASYDNKNINGLSPLGESENQALPSRDLTGVLMQLEELQHNACERIFQLVDEKKSLMCERDVAQLSTTAAESEVTLLKQKFEHEIMKMVDKLDVSNALLQKVQLYIDAFAERLEVSSKIEEEYMQQHNELLSDLDRLEVGLEELTSKNQDIAHEILAFETLTARELTKKNHALTVSLQDKNEECTKLALELKCLKESLRSLYDENQALMATSRDKMEESVWLASELNNIRNSLQYLINDKQEVAKPALERNSLKGNFQSPHGDYQILTMSSLDKTEESVKLASELNSLKQSLQSLHDDKEAWIASMEESARLAEELNHLKENLQSLHLENKALVASSQDKAEESSKLALELSSLKEIFQSLNDEKQTLIASLQNKVKESANLALELNHLKEALQSLHDEKQVVMASLQDKTEETSMLASKLNCLKESFQTLHDHNQVLEACSWEKSEESAKIKSEVNSLRECAQSLHSENQTLIMSSQYKTNECVQLASELNRLGESLQSLHDQLQEERSLRESLESKITDHTSKLTEKEVQLLHFKELVSGLELEKLRVCSLLSHYDESLQSAREECASLSGLESELCELHELLIAADVKLIFTKTQYEGRAEELVLQLSFSNRSLAELQKQHIDVETNLNCCLASEAQYIEDNSNLLTSLNSIRSEMEASIAENRLILEENRAMAAELQEYRYREQNVGLQDFEDKSQHYLEVERLKHTLLSSEEDINNLIFSKEELEVKVLVLKAKLNEQKDQIIAMEGYSDELIILKKQCNELTKRLAEQILKTEEFRNLSVHLKELKDKADAECIQACEKREPEAPPVAMHESLRIAFIKEQYETRLQELKQQLSISKKHSEEMLWKLQDAINEIENRKKSEACHLKKNEELGMKILELEDELQSVLSDKRERMNAYDRMKAEMECSLISLECCREEKHKLEVCLQECNQEKSKIAAELTQTKELLENSKLALNIQEEGNHRSCKKDSKSSDESVIRNVYPENPIADASIFTRKSVDAAPANGPNRDSTFKSFKEDSSRNCEEAEHKCPAPISTVDQTNILMNKQLGRDLVSSCANRIQSPILLNEDELLHSDMKHLATINEHFRAESLKSSVDHLSNEVNEELGSMFPMFNESPGSGNALERVLALEIELAEALQGKKRSSFHFQSSLLKQHSDEEAVFKSFRDINELIKDMLEIKGMYTAVETELKEMHDRYSQLSLRFAEVEGERQKLIMTLKNVRASKKALQLNQSSSASTRDHSL